MAEVAGLHHVALSVRDIDHSAAWYRDVLGLIEETRLTSADRRSVILRLPGSAAQLGLVEHADSGAGFDARNLGLDHVAFTVGSGEEMAAWAERLEEAGVGSSGVLETPFGAMLHFADPDGIALALFWNR